MKYNPDTTFQPRVMNFLTIFFGHNDISRIYLPQYPSGHFVIELVACSVPACSIICQMGWQMRDKWNFLRHPRLTSGGEG